MLEQAVTDTLETNKNKVSEIANKQKRNSKETESLNQKENT